MTEYLVKRLRESCYLAFDDGTNDYATAISAADLIEGLEKEVEGWKKRCLSMFVEFIMLGSTSAEKINVRAIFEDAEELLMEEKENDR